MKNRIKLDPATIVIGIFFVIAAIFLMMPFYFMFLSSQAGHGNPAPWSELQD